MFLPDMRKNGANTAINTMPAGDPSTLCVTDGTTMFMCRIIGGKVNAMEMLMRHDISQVANSMEMLICRPIVRYGVNTMEMERVRDTAETGIKRAMKVMADNDKKIASCFIQCS